ncbi:MAG: glycoside hydrolase family 3 protein [Oscillospiraceae bacterium]
MKKILDWDKYIETAERMVAEGIVMLKNENDALPLAADKEIAVFGRIQLHYYKSGTGSGGMVNVSKTINIVDGLIENGIKLNQELLDVYKKWDSENPFDLGSGWGDEPWSQKEMPLDDELVKRISEKCETAVIVIGRTAGEEQDNRYEKGSYMLSDSEEDMLEKVGRYFKKVVILLNTGNIIDMSVICESHADAILYVWQGGMVGGMGTADVLAGKSSPCGKLPDTIAKNISDYPSHEYFGDENRNFYKEDIYVGYRYFETFAKDKVLYPFGFGLSYTTFDVNYSAVKKDDIISISADIRNTGNAIGKEVIQIYCEAPQGKLGKPSRVLCGFEKSSAINPNENDTVSIDIDIKDLASYDDSGNTGFKSCYVLEKGEYNIYAGTDVRSAKKIFSFETAETYAVSQHSQAMAPVMEFERFKPVKTDDGFMVSMENVPLSEVDESARRLAHLPEEIEYTGDKGIKLKDVLDGKNTMEEFIAQLSDNELSYIICGEGMGSPRVTAGTASAFGGVSDELVGYGIPAACCADGPSGMRLDCGTKAFSIPNGTLIASTFNKALAKELFVLMGLEMRANKVDCLLGPGMNIHRHPLNGRNFEYFSEDPYLTGMMAAAELNGLHESGVTGTIKHFCANNQETRRHFTDSVISERALREIYLKGFEIAVKKGNADSIMTSYGSVNGLWTAGNFDLNTTVLRDEWGFTGFTMTDWWANINERNVPVCKTNYAAMAMAQNDVYMVCADCSKNEGNAAEYLEKGILHRSELQRNAMNICRFLLKTYAMKRIAGIDEKVEIINNHDKDMESEEPLVFYDIDDELTIIPENISTDKGMNYCFALVVNDVGFYRMTITASSTQSELAQIPLTVFAMGTAQGTFTWNGTNGEPVSFTTEIPMFSKFTTLRLYFAQSGLKIHSIEFKHTGDRKRRDM